MSRRKKVEETRWEVVFSHALEVFYPLAVKQIRSEIPAIYQSSVLLHLFQEEFCCHKGTVFLTIQEFSSLLMKAGFYTCFCGRSEVEMGPENPSSW